MRHHDQTIISVYLFQPQNPPLSFYVSGKSYHDQALDQCWPVLVSGTSIQVMWMLLKYQVFRHHNQAVDQWWTVLISEHTLQLLWVHRHDRSVDKWSPILVSEYTLQSLWIPFKYHKIKSWSSCTLVVYSLGLTTHLLVSMISPQISRKPSPWSTFRPAKNCLASEHSLQFLWTCSHSKEFVIMIKLLASGDLSYFQNKL